MFPWKIITCPGRSYLVYRVLEKFSNARFDKVERVERSKGVVYSFPRVLVVVELLNKTSGRMSEREKQ